MLCVCVCVCVCVLIASSVQPDLANIPAAMKFVDSKIIMGDFASILYLCLPIGGNTSVEWGCIFLSSPTLSSRTHTLCSRCRGVPGPYLCVRLCV